MSETPTVAGNDASRASAKRKPLAAAATIGVVFVGLAAASSAVRVDSPRGDIALHANPPGLVIERLDRMSRVDGTRDRLELLDPTPLFMPRGDTPVGTNSATLTQRPGGKVAEQFPPSLTFPARGAGAEILAPAGPVSAFEAMTVVTAPRFFEGLARADRPATEPAPKARAARVEIYQTDEGKFTRVVDLDELGGAVPANWRPMELSLLVTPFGGVAGPSIVSSSGSEEVDQAIRKRMVSDVLLKVALRPGIYRIVVGP